MKNNHLEWIDSYKGILMLMVVISHILSFTSFHGLGYEEFLSYPFRSMRMPAFFFISGYLLSRKYTEFSGFFGHRFRQIVVPYFLFFLFHYLFWFYITRDTYPNDFTWIDPFIGLLEGKAERISEMQFTMLTAYPLWFVTTLFIAELYFFTAKKIVKNNFQMLFLLMFLSLLGFFLSYYLNKVDIRPWWNIDIAITAAVFYGLGYLVKTNNLINKLEISNNWLKLFLVILFFTITASMSLTNYTSIAFGKYGNPALFYIGALSGILALVFFVQFRLIRENSLLKYFGKNTYLILAFHTLALYFTNYILLNISSDPYAQSLLGSFSYIVLLFIIMVLIIEIFNRFLPKILGR